MYTWWSLADTMQRTFASVRSLRGVALVHRLKTACSLLGLSETSKSYWSKRQGRAACKPEHNGRIQGSNSSWIEIVRPRAVLGMDEQANLDLVAFLSREHRRQWKVDLGTRT